MSGPTGITASAQALTTIEHVKQFMGKKDQEPYQDQLIQLLINSASDHIHTVTSREFKSALSPNPGVRNFALQTPFPGWTYVNFGRFQCQAGTVTLVQIDTDVSSPGATTITSDQYQLFPISNDFGIVTGIRFYTYAVGPVLRQGANIPRQLSVTATWGWSSVPAAVEQACILTVATWVRRDSQQYSSTFNTEEAAHQRPQAIPSAAWDLLAPYMKVPV